MTCVSTKVRSYLYDMIMCDINVPKAFPIKRENSYLDQVNYKISSTSSSLSIINHTHRRYVEFCSYSSFFFGNIMLRNMSLNIHVQNKLRVQSQNIKIGQPALNPISFE